MIRKSPATIAMALMAVCASLSHSQSFSQTTLKIDLQNAVEYQGDIADPSQFATKSSITPSTQPKNFYVATLIADIVAVNGQPAKGTYVSRSRVVILSPTPTGL